MGGHVGVVEGAIRPTGIREGQTTSSPPNQDRSRRHIRPHDVVVHTQLVMDDLVTHPDDLGPGNVGVSLREIGRDAVAASPMIWIR